MSVNCTLCLGRISPLAFTGMRISTGRWPKRRHVGCVFSVSSSSCERLYPNPACCTTPGWLEPNVPDAGLDVVAQNMLQGWFDFNAVTVEWLGCWYSCLGIDAVYIRVNYQSVSAVKAIIIQDILHLSCLWTWNDCLSCTLRCKQMSIIDASYEETSIITVRVAFTFL